MSYCKVYTTNLRVSNIGRVFISGLMFIFLMSSCAKDEALVDSRDNFTGYWAVLETTSGKKAVYPFHVTISKSSKDNDSISISNFYNVKAVVFAKVSGNDMMIPRQKSEGFWFQGSGSYSQKDENITVSYTIDDESNQLIHATAIYSKD